MEISSTSQMQQMDQLQLRKMDGSGGGQGQGQGGGMSDIMSSLSSEDRVQLQEQMSSLSPEDRQATMEQMKQVDSTSLSSDEYMDTLLDLISPSEDDENANNTTTITEAYA